MARVDVCIGMLPVGHIPLEARRHPVALTDP